MEARIKFIITEGGNKLSIKDKTISVKLHGVHIQREADNTDLDVFRDKEGFDRGVKDIKNLRIIANDDRDARKIFALLNLKHKIRRENEF
jgi:hypothetical protein